MGDSRDLRDGCRVFVAGLVITLRAPETAKGHVFITPEDEHWTVNTILRPHVTQRYKPVVPRTWLLLIEG